MNFISSNQNTLIKDIKALKVRKYREERKEFFIEGARFLEEALKEKLQISRIFLSSSFIENKCNNDFLSILSSEMYDAFVLTDKLFEEISDTENPQGVLAVLKMKNYSFNEILSNNNMIIILESIQDPGNMGTIIRTADAAGFSGIVISKGCVDIYNPKVLRSTMGSIFHLPMYLSENLMETIDEMKQKGIKLFASHLSSTSSFFETNLTGDIAIIIGNEANGISSEIASKADSLIKIPMSGKAESLNVSVAAGLLMYEAVRQRIM